MRPKYAFLAIGPLLAAALVGSAPAQQEAPARGSLADYAAPAQRPAAPSTPAPAAIPMPSGAVYGRSPANFYSPYVTSFSSAVDAARVPLMAEEASLSQDVAKLVEQMNASDSNSEKADLKSKLGDALGKQFDLRQKRHQQEIDSLEAQVKKLKELVQRRQDNREEIVSRKLEQIIRDSQGLGF